MVEQDRDGQDSNNYTTQHNTTQHNTTRHDTTRHDTTQHDTTQNDTRQHDTTQHNTARPFPTLTEESLSLSIQGGVREMFSEEGRREFSNERSAAKFWDKKTTQIGRTECECNTTMKLFEK